MGKLAKLLWVSTKLGVAGGSVYLTSTQGVWGNSHRSQEICQQAYDEIPGLKSFREEYLKDILPTVGTEINVKDSWNSAVLFTFNFLGDLPAKSIQFKDYVVDSAKSLANSLSDQS